MNNGRTMRPHSVPDDFDKRMALEVIEDVLSTLATPEDRGLAMGLCGAFYMCGLLSHAEWESLMERIFEMREAWGAVH